MSDRRVAKYLLPVDGFCESTNEIFEFQECIFHECGKCYTNRDSNENLKELNRKLLKSYEADLTFELEFFMKILIMFRDT